jgi:hypothetical protein
MPATASKSLSEQELAIVAKALRASVEGPFFPEDEFQTLFGVDRDEVASLLARFRNIDVNQEADFLVVNNALLWLVSYPHHLENHLRDFGLSDGELTPLLRSIRRRLGKPAATFADYLE